MTYSLKAISILMLLGLAFSSMPAQRKGKEAASPQDQAPQSQPFQRLHDKIPERGEGMTFREYMDHLIAQEPVQDGRKARTRYWGWAALALGIAMLAALGGGIAFVVRAQRATDGFGGIAEALGAILMFLLAFILFVPALVLLVLYLNWRKRDRKAAAG